MLQRTFVVTGMTCDHCVAAVESEVGTVAGVVTARADLASGRLEVESEMPVDPAAVADAVTAAGYTVASP